MSTPVTAAWIRRVSRHPTASRAAMRKVGASKEKKERALETEKAAPRCLIHHWLRALAAASQQAAVLTRTRKKEKNSRKPGATAGDSEDISTCDKMKGMGTAQMTRLRPKWSMARPMNGWQAAVISMANVQHKLMLQLDSHRSSSKSSVNTPTAKVADGQTIVCVSPANRTMM